MVKRGRGLNECAATAVWMQAGQMRGSSAELVVAGCPRRQCLILSKNHSTRLRARPGSQQPPSLRPDTCELDHLGPFVDVFGDELGELVRRVRGHRHRAEIGEPL